MSGDEVGELEFLREEGQPEPKKKSRSGSAGWTKFNQERAKKNQLVRDRIEFEKEMKMKGFPTRRLRCKQSVHKNTRVIHHNVKRTDWPEMVSVSTQTDPDDCEGESEQLEVNEVADEESKERRGACGAYGGGPYMVPNIYGEIDEVSSAGPYM